jgi:SAM-dependent methyltransferase
VDSPPEDPSARQEWLRRWVEEKQREKQIPGDAASEKPFASTRWKLASRLSRASVVLDWIHDRGLATARSGVRTEDEDTGRLTYVPSAWGVLPRALRYLGVSASDVFVDYGCGKGRVLHQAAKWPFRRVIGVEVSPVLAEAARVALDSRRHQYRCGEVEVVVMDAKDFRPPDDLTIAYFFHPGLSAETVEAVLSRIVESIDRHPRRVRLIVVAPLYIGDVQDAHVYRTGRFRLVKEQSPKLLDPTRSRVAIFESN